MSKPSIADAFRAFSHAFDVLAEAVEDPVPPALDVPNPVDVVFAIADVHFGYGKEELSGRGQTQPLVTIRHAVAYVLRTELDLSFPAIGELLGRDHSTIMSAVKSVEKWHPQAKKRYVSRMAGAAREFRDDG